MIHRLLEILFGLSPGFLGRPGDYSITFNPAWPLQETLGASVWNVLLVMAAALLVVHVYRREGSSRAVRVSLGIVRAFLLALVIILLNRPALTLEQIRHEPSVLPILVDDSISMSIKDAAPQGAAPQSRFQAATDLLTGPVALLRELAKKHTLKLYRFDRDAQPIATVNQSDPDHPADENPSLRPAEAALNGVSVLGQTTQVLSSIKSVVEELQSQRLAGIVLLTDGRDVPMEPTAELLNSLKDAGVNVYAVPVGADRAPQNISIQSVSLEPSTFKDDIADIKVTVRGTGYEANHPVTLDLKNKKTGLPIMNDDGSPVRQVVKLPDSGPVLAELQFRPHDVGTMELTVEAVPQPGETDELDNVRYVQLEVLDTKITLLYVDGYPRWEYRYLKNETIRDKTISVSCLLTSADPSFIQEGTRPIRRFPESMEELLTYDVVLFGDVDPRQFTDAQLQLVSDFVSKKGGGFGMVAGPRWSPQAFRNTPIEALLPVNISHVDASPISASIVDGFRPVLTPAGADSHIFRFFVDRARNEQYIATELQPIFWYCRGITVKPGVGEVYAQHPTDLGPDGRKAPILVVGHFGGPTLFSAIDDSWRWRYYTGESIFDTYWVQQLRFLARGRKLGQRKLTFTSMQPTYELGQTITLQARALSPQIQTQLPDHVPVELVDDSGQLIGRHDLVRQESQPDLMSVSFTADAVGHLTARLPKVVGDIDVMETPVDVMVPRLELADPAVDRGLLGTLGKIVEPADAAQLPSMIQSAAKIIPVDTSVPIWSAPLAMVLFVVLITGEWILRKIYGML